MVARFSPVLEFAVLDGAILHTIQLPTLRAPPAAAVAAAAAAILLCIVHRVVLSRQLREMKKTV